MAAYHLVKSFMMQRMYGNASLLVSVFEKLVGHGSYTVQHYCQTAEIVLYKKMENFCLADVRHFVTSTFEIK